jgi:hypothetical protein
MARKSMAELTAQWSSKTTGTSSTNQNWKKFFQFWKMPDDSTCIVRFLPDADSDNPIGFLVENYTHTLYVNGDKKVVPCLKHLHGEKCAVCDLSSKYYGEAKDAERNGDTHEKERLETLGKKYYRKLSYIGQVLVVESPIEHDAEQLVKLIDFGPKIFKVINAAYKSGDLECTNGPDDLKGGYNFRIKKTKDGKWSDYGTSSFSPKQSDVDDAIIEQLELYDLKEWREPRQDPAMIEAMLMADRTGSTFTDNQDSAPAESAPVRESAPAESAPAESAPVRESAPAAESAPPANEKVADVLANLRARAAAKAAAAS